MVRQGGFVLWVGLAAVLLACTPADMALTPPALPTARWDGQEEAALWSRATLMAVEVQDASLARAVPQDVASFCPGYEKAGIAQRREFWVGVVSLTALAESGFNPEAVGPGGYAGLMQISPRTAAAAGCGVMSRAELKDGENNLFCAVQIMAHAVAADQVVTGAHGNRGLGRDWTPWRKAAFRKDARQWLAGQSYCAL